MWLLLHFDDVFDRVVKKSMADTSLDDRRNKCFSTRGTTIFKFVSSHLYLILSIVVVCICNVKISFFVINSKDPSPHDNDRYSDRMLLEVEVKDFRKVSLGMF